MGNCSGNCSGCSGCARELVLTPEEVSFLEKLGQIPFLPVARTLGDLTPVYLEEGPERAGECSLILQCLEKKGLISLDYDRPLGAPGYEAYPIQGSIALTERGYGVLELLEYQGFHTD